MNTISRDQAIEIASRAAVALDYPIQNSTIHVTYDPATSDLRQLRDFDECWFVKFETPLTFLIVKVNAEDGTYTASEPLWGT